ncbi:hypothetical protein JRQ81_018420 [Phrynocephalus forsythii]|uniref:Sodium channel protein n=1 Tax=Phrynocephalus forsythii TaxID=171643 RepID=A0A9Q0XNG5_9SAUR|nr:hypothetical protein JRQ81_018420 [Phrynocephalus forsythii]
MLRLSKQRPRRYVFTSVYTAELGIKVVARGFVLNEFTYLRDPWNILDFFVLIMTYISFSQSFGSISALRIFRILRTLKAVSVIPGLKVIIASLFQSVKKLANVMLLTVFSLAVFALVGLQLFMGNLKFKCVHKDFVNATYNSCKSDNPENDMMYRKMPDSSGPLLCGYSSDPNTTECRHPNYICIKHGENPDHGYTSFDHFGWAFLSLFRLMTQDSWELLYRQVIRTSGKSFVIFFVIVIFLCSFYLFNLILAVVTMAYDEQNKATAAYIKAKEKLFHEAKEILRKEKEMAVQRHIASTDENIEMSRVESKNRKDKKGKKKKECKSSTTRIYGEDETMFYSTPDKSQKELKELLTSYQLPVDADPFQRQKLTSAAHVISKTMEWEERKLEFPPFLKEATRKYLIWQCCPFWLQIKQNIKKIMINPFMELFITLCIVVNTLLMALENICLNQDVVSRANCVFTAIFTAEVVLKIIALDPYYYFQTAWNSFDFIVVVIGIINMIFGTQYSFFRMLRIFKLSKFWPALNKLMKIMFKSVGPLSNLTLVLIFTIFIFAVVGKQVFGNYYRNASSCSICVDDQVPSCNRTERACRLRWHMEDFFHSFLIIFRILCGEWIDTMWGCMLVAGKEGCIILFMFVLVVGNLVVLNLFIALLLSSFSSSNPESEADDAELKPQAALAHIRQGLRSAKEALWNCCCNRFQQKRTTANLKNKEVAITIPKANAPKSVKEVQENGPGGENLRRYGKPLVDGKEEDFMRESSTTVPVPLADQESLNDEGGYAVTETDWNKQVNPLRIQGEKWKKSRLSQVSESTSTGSLSLPKILDYDTISYSDTSTVDHRSPTCQISPKKKEPKDCFPQVLVHLFPCCSINMNKFPGNIWWNFRKTCYQIIKHSWFESFSIFMILVSSGALIFEDIYLEERRTIKTLLEYADIFFFYIFFLEMLLKWAAYGFWKYFTSGWCLLDFCIVCVSIMALRPLRALSRFKGIKVVVNALAGAVPSIGNVLLVCIVLWLPFNILGMQLFGSKFENCNITLPDKNTCKDVNFNHVGMGYLALLQVATFKGWLEIMYSAKNGLPCFENKVYAYIYFVVFIIFGSFFMLNLFIGVVIDNFNQQRKKICGELIFLTEDQKKYYNALKKLGSKKPYKPVPPPLNKYQIFLFNIVTKQAFDIFIISLILLNVVIMMVDHEDQGEESKSHLEKINIVFVGIFTGECLMKMLALRLYFFKDGWNIFDFLVVILSFFSAAAFQLRKSLNFPPTILRVIRVARVSRLLRLVRGAKGLRTLLFALLMSLPALVNIGLLLFLIMFIYAIFGMENFACASMRGGIDEIFNFQTFGNSMLCLFQITTSAGWSDLLNPMLSRDDSIPCAVNTEHKGPCVNRGLAIAYFVSYIIISFLIVVNMYIAVILENLNVATEESTEPLGDDDFEIFYEVWARFDPQATQFISYMALSDFADALEEPLRIPKPNRQQLMAMDLPMVNGNKIHCLDILFAFTKKVLGEAGEMDMLESQIEGKYPKKISYEPIVTTPRRQMEECAIIIQRAFRKHLSQRATEDASRKASVPNTLESIPEERGASTLRLEESEGESNTDGSQSPASLCIPPSYSNITGATEDVPQDRISENMGGDDSK